jgi:hypothetical protein
MPFRCENNGLDCQIEPLPFLRLEVQVMHGAAKVFGASSLPATKAS